VEPKELHIQMRGAEPNSATVGPIIINNQGPDVAFKLSISVLEVSFFINIILTSKNKMTEYELFL